MLISIIIPVYNEKNTILKLLDTVHSSPVYYARENLELVEVNDNFREFLPVLGNVCNAYFPDVLTQLGMSMEQV